MSRVLNVNVGILGHVDSGKTSVAKSLSTIASTSAFDKNPQSKKRGITLDLGFSSFVINGSLPQNNNYDRIQFTLVDCPGHSSLIRTVLCGTCCHRSYQLLIRFPNHWYHASGGGCNEGISDTDVRMLSYRCNHMWANGCGFEQMRFVTRKYTWATDWKGEEDHKTYNSLQVDEETRFENTGIDHICRGSNRCHIGCPGWCSGKLTKFRHALRLLLRHPFTWSLISVWVLFYFNFVNNLALVSSDSGF